MYALTHEFAAPRIRAAMAWANLSRADAAKAMNISPSQLDRMTGKRPTTPYAPTWAQVGALAEAAGLPFEWFVADFDQAGKIPAFSEAVELSRLEAKARLRRREAAATRRTVERPATPDETTRRRGGRGTAS
jgi:hypothetical protein